MPMSGEPKRIGNFFKLPIQLFFMVFLIPNSRYVAFSQLKFTQDALASCDTLHQFFMENRSAGIVNFEEIVSIVDVKQIIDCDRKKIYSEKIESVEVLSGFNYHIVCKLKTWLYKIKNPNFPSKLFSFYCWLGINNSSLKNYS